MFYITCYAERDLRCLWRIDTVSVKRWDPRNALLGPKRGRPAPEYSDTPETVVHAARKQSDGKAKRFYRDLEQREVSVRVGMEATGYALWFARLRAELGFEPWIG
jgi:hypothetical protein